MFPYCCCNWRSWSYDPIGDAYMTAGLPVAVEDHAIRAAHMALAMMESNVLPDGFS